MTHHNQAFSVSALSRCIYPEDFYDDSRLSSDIYREDLVRRALNIAENNFEDGINYQKFFLNDKDKAKNKPTFFSTSIEEKLILRRCASNIRQTLNRKQKFRSCICREIKTFLKEGTKFRVYKIDIKSFFESITPVIVKKTLDDKGKISTHTKNLINIYLNEFDYFVPRGMEFSSTIAELVLEEFDEKLIKDNRIIYYSRYVDDILIITCAGEEKNKFYNEVEGLLPKGLKFNYNKKEIIDVAERKKSGGNQNGTEVAKFDYLGYEYRVIDTFLEPKDNSVKAKFRKVEINIASNKLKLIKTKISKALVYYGKNGNFEMLKARIKFLTSNRDLVQKTTGHAIPTGIYYNYNLVDSDSNSFTDLDNSLRKFILSYDSLFKKPTFKPLLVDQKRVLLKCAFAQGFNKRIYKKYSPKALKEIVKIWK
jgi:hypothetical protein